MEYTHTVLHKAQLSSTIWMLVTLALMCTSHAYGLVHTDVSNTSYYKELIRRNMIVVDELHMPSLGKRQASNGTQDSSTSTPSLNTDTGLPVPFDTSLGNNFTDATCPDYFDKFLSDSTFKSCLPMSLLLQNSMSFFQAVRSPSLLQKTLDVSCSASLAECSPLMAKFAGELIAQGNCYDDYQRQNPLVLQAYAGLKAYEALYQATCLKDQTTSQYCFLEAMNSNNTDESYPYYTAIGLQLPAGAKPACTACLKQTMDIFAGYAQQKDQPLSQTYLSCATQVDAGCGSGFANTQIKSVSNVTSDAGPAKLGTSVQILLAASLSFLSMFI